MKPDREYAVSGYVKRVEQLLISCNVLCVYPIAYRTMSTRMMPVLFFLWVALAIACSVCYLQYVDCLLLCALCYMLLGRKWRTNILAFSLRQEVTKDRRDGPSSTLDAQVMGSCKEMVTAQE